jgi:hypothetical protein
MIRSFATRFGAAVLSALFLASSAVRVARADDLPPHMKLIAGHPATTSAQTAQDNVLALDLAMFGYYDAALALYKKHLLAQHPVILALFSGGGGKLTLYRPGQPPLDADPVPVGYQLLKSTCHSALAIFEISGPYVNDPSDVSWMQMMRASRAEQQAALDTIGDLAVDPQWRDTMKAALVNDIAFMDGVIAKRVITYDAMQAFAHQQSPLLRRMVAWAANAQVDHWMDVMAAWKKMLGSDWDQTYALSNAIYVTRQNNVLFSVLAQFFGPDAVNARLFLFETTDFATTSDDMLTLLTRVVADRSVGQTFFGNYYMMDYELMGGDARDAVIASDKRLGIAPFLPPLVPFGSHQWPALVTPGAGPATLEQLPQVP